MIDIIGTIGLCILCWFIGTWAGVSDGRIQVEKDAVKTECARYHQETGKFEWIVKESSGR